MSILVSQELLTNTLGEETRGPRQLAQGMRNGHEVIIDLSLLSKEGLEDLLQAAQVIKDGKTERALKTVMEAREGVFGKPIPNFKAFKGVLDAYLLHELIDGWLYVERDDGRLYPELVANVTFESGGGFRGVNEEPKVRIHTVAYGVRQDGNYRYTLENQRYTHSFHPGEVKQRRIDDILRASGLHKETAELKADYLKSLENFQKTKQNAFTQQFRALGRVLTFEEDNHRRRGQEMKGARVIHDMDDNDFRPVHPLHESCLFADKDGELRTGVVPVHPIVRVFSLDTHEFLWINGDHLKQHVYDKSLGDKLVLPDSHRDLLDVLTSDIDAFVDDIIEGKRAGNVILGKGIPGVGKTLTAEVYAELIERPLYAIHTGSLGTTAEAIEKNLRIIFQRGKRWNCVLLLDEADVFVVQRGNNIEQNAIVAEFLRTLEYFDGLLFMTTNRPDDIDDAIISRCAAIIEYKAPTPEDAAKIWRICADFHQLHLDDELLAALVTHFPSITPRDIKMLFRLAVRVAKVHNEDLSLELFRRCAMFKAVQFEEAKQN